MNVGILGLGLIGGSLARAYALEGHTVLACEKDEQMLSFAILAGAVHSTLDESNIASCDLILLAIYPDSSAAWLEEFFLQVLDTFLAPGTIGYAAAEAFLIVAIAEEGCKLFFLKKLTWKSSHFNYRFDGIIFAVFTGLGFAGLENILYVLNFGPDVLVSRGLLAVPGHMTFAVFMGLHYSESKLASLRGQHSKAKRSLRKAFLIPVLLHGFYDFCLMSERDILSIVFILFVIVLDLSAARAVRRTSRSDHPL